MGIEQQATGIEQRPAELESKVDLYQILACKYDAPDDDSVWEIELPDSVLTGGANWGCSLESLTRSAHLERQLPLWQQSGRRVGRLFVLPL